MSLPGAHLSLVLRLSQTRGLVLGSSEHTGVLPLGCLRSTRESFRLVPVPGRTWAGTPDSPACSPPGLGLALNFQPSLIMLNRYFNSGAPWPTGWRQRAARCSCAPLSPLGQVLQDHYGWRAASSSWVACCSTAACVPHSCGPGGTRQSSGSGPAPQRPPRLLDLSVFRDVAKSSMPWPPPSWCWGSLYHLCSW